MSPGPKELYTKKYGQVLLRNPKVARFEVEALKLPSGSRILEIGPGPGTLTSILLEKGYIVEAIEPDHRFYEELLGKLSQYLDAGTLTLTKASFLDIAGLKCDGIIGNVPYHISSEIIFHLGNFEFKKAVLMLQREFCNRLISQVGSKDYSRLSVNAQLRFRIKVIAKVSRNSFSPVPEVDSSVIEIIPRCEYEEDVIRKADAVFRKLFSNRRKKLSSSLRNITGELGNKRVNELSPEKLLEIALQEITGQSRSLLP